MPNGDFVQFYSFSELSTALKILDMRTVDRSVKVGEPSTK
jgi:hypothetical protein